MFFSWSDILPLQEMITHDEKWNPFFEDKLSIRTTNLRPDEKMRRKSSAPFQVYERPKEEVRKKKWSNICSKVGLEVDEIKIEGTHFSFKDLDSFRGF